jgi:hypothetical protein
MRSNLNRIAVALAAAAVLAALTAIGDLWSGIGDSEISVVGWLAMGIGIIVTLAVGIGLMSLIFISARRGYDEIGREDS